MSVAAIGLNWRNLEHWSGRLDANHLSSENTGLVTTVGARVGGLKIGNSVYELGKDQSGNYTRVPAAFASRIRPDDDMVQMAFIPLTYTTAMYTFDHISNLIDEQSVLIYSVAKNVELASIRLAQGKGADVFAMVDTAEKASFLAAEMGISASYGISTPNLANLRQAAQITRNGGFDVILSNAEGELSYLSLQVLAPLGYLLDVGRVDIQTAPAMSLELLWKKVIYCLADFFVILDTESVLAEKELMQAVNEYYCKGLVGFIQRITTTNVAQSSPVLGTFFDLIGKLVVSFENPSSLIRMVPSAPTVAFDSESLYVITGALSGLSQSLIQ